jgi:hypothetical protein
MEIIKALFFVAIGYYIKYSIEQKKDKTNDTDGAIEEKVDAAIEDIEKRLHQYFQDTNPSLEQQDIAEKVVNICENRSLTNEERANL